MRSIIGRFLEHTRVYLFHNNGEQELYCSSADLMERNMFNRVEIAFPIIDKPYRTRIMDELDLYLADNRQAWELSADGTYTHIETDDEHVTAQGILLKSLAES